MVPTITIKIVFKSMSGELPNDVNDIQNEEDNFTHPVSSQAKQDECKGNKNGIVAHITNMIIKQYFIIGY